jgi:SM-20-related protein
MGESADMGRLYSAPFLTEDERRALCEEMRGAERFPATAHKGGAYSVQPDVRRTSRVRVGDAWVEFVSNRLIEWRPRLVDHFGVPLGDCQEPQFLAYSVGDFFRPHRDRGTGPLDPEPARNRRLSVVILLNPGEYEGGALTLHEMSVPGSRLEIPGRPGRLIAFNSLVLHEVKPVIAGERYSIASWYEQAR